MKLRLDDVHPGADPVFVGTFNVQENERTLIASSLQLAGGGGGGGVSVSGIGVRLDAMGEPKITRGRYRATLVLERVGD